MTSGKELRQNLDELPPVAYELGACLTRFHWLFHQAKRVDSRTPIWIGKLTTAEEIADFVNSIKPTNLAQALDLTNEIVNKVFDSGCLEGSDTILKLALEIYRDHYPPEKIDHEY